MLASARSQPIPADHRRYATADLSGDLYLIRGLRPRPRHSLSARRVASVDSFVPLGPAAAFVLVSEESIVEGAAALLAG